MGRQSGLPIAARNQRAWCRPSRSIPAGQGRCRTTGPSVPSAASRRIHGSHPDRSSRRDRQAGRGVPAPPVIEFDADGQVVQTWGGPGTATTGPTRSTASPSTRRTASGSAATARRTRTSSRSRGGKFLRQIGRPGQAAAATTRRTWHATQMRVDPQSNEVYRVGRRENRNHRVIVFDSDTGAYKRHWGAYGENRTTRPRRAVRSAGPPPKQFGNAVHCLRIARDGLVYVCDRANNRFQIFRKDGSFVKEISSRRRPRGAAWDIDFSPDQRFMYVADGTNQKVWILERDRLQVVGRSAGAGRARDGSPPHCTTCRSIRRATYIPAKPPPPAACRNSRASELTNRLTPPPTQQ